MNRFHVSTVCRHAVFVLVSLLLYSGAHGQPTVEIQVVRNDLLVYEHPRVRLKVTAPKKNEIKIVKEEYTNTRMRMVLFIDLIDPDAKVRTGVPSNQVAAFSLVNEKRPVELQSLKPGESMTMTYPVALRPQKAGLHKIKVTWRPTDEKSFTITKELELRVHPLTEKAILSRIPVKFPVPDDRNPLKGQIDILKIKTKDGYDLAFRYQLKNAYAYTGRPRTLIKITRFAKVDKDTHFTALGKLGFRKQEEVWVGYTAGGELRVARLLAVTGDSLVLQR